MNTKKATMEAAGEHATKLPNKGENPNNFSQKDGFSVDIKVTDEGEKQENPKQENPTPESKEGNNLPFLDIWNYKSKQVNFLFKRGDVGVIANKNLHTVKGKTGTRKTFLAMDFILAAMGKSDIFSLNGDEPLTVLWCDVEQDPDTIVERATTAFTARGVTPDMPVHVLTLKMTERKERKAVIMEAVRLVKPKLLIIDVMPKIMEIGINEKHDTAEAFNEEFCQLAQEYDCAVIGVIHTNKDAGDDNAGGHGGTTQEQLSAEVYMMKDGCIQNTKRRFSKELPPIKILHKDDWTISADSNVVQEKKDDDLISLAQKCFEGEGKVEVRRCVLTKRIMENKNIENRQASGIIKTMLDCGIIEKRSVSRREVYYSLHTQSEQIPPCS